ncbi:hypothetical protein [Asanoa sp. NPDC050611]|uniref:hypothetical protein n=1 Tax=Asanoa sp. NPDC050611 TaxID=3157098 RepID=UPI0033FADB17
MPHLSRLPGWFSDHPSIDFVVAAVVVGAHALTIQIIHAGDFLLWLGPERRADLYSQTAAVVASLGGLSAIGLAIYQSASGDRSKAVRVLYGSELRRNWRCLLVMAGVSSGLALLAMSLDRGTDVVRARFVFEFAVALAIIRYVRLIWVFDGILALADKDLTDPGRPAASPLSARWIKSP